ncbi:bifunctional 2-polyprenyl-6-hydroxyphenol methylase/3-demethylubiquinol 3-O-methyltransferase UbiG [Streptomyces sp. UNOC14_S4]|uniref:class I SAM-dependent methyltransferase n=1 Tax=Streptomyces sp. UNOC14_S4 TaxID=2872340 RepID=UPI001E42ADDE|nr:class I SAM-dependent methyltransferase [Streptomyces sp. UNOC14_S4]MCC3768529.1 class I SAM-dependent methyltransferase [Streptomyces sp. UNOC14_S4]
MTNDNARTPAHGHWRDLNHARWEERVAIHSDSDFYDLPGFRAGRDDLRGFERDEAGDVTGKRLLHLQCHIGTDTLSWARHGARVTGLDFSAAAVAAARKLAADVGIDDARFVESDVYDAPSALGGETFDIVYTGFGALCWLPDIDRWARTVAELLAPGGFLYLAEFHPAGACLDMDGATWAEDYFARDPLVYEEQGTYTDRQARTRHNTAVEWQHPIGDVVSAVTAAGLRLAFLREYDFTLFEQTDGMVKGPDTSGTRPGAASVYRLPEGRPRVPLIYSLRASK